MYGEVIRKGHGEPEDMDVVRRKHTKACVPQAILHSVRARSANPVPVCVHSVPGPSRPAPIINSASFMNSTVKFSLQRLQPDISK